MDMKRDFMTDIKKYNKKIPPQRTNLAIRKENTVCKQVLYIQREVYALYNKLYFLTEKTKGGVCYEEDHFHPDVPGIACECLAHDSRAGR